MATTRGVPHACAGCRRPTLPGRFRGEAAIYCPFATFGRPQEGGTGLLIIVQVKRKNLGAALMAKDDGIVEELTKSDGVESIFSEC